MSDQPLLAFAVTEPMENTGAVIFAKSNIVARRLGANEYNDGELGGMSCRRAPWADRFAGQPVPVSVMVDHGWHFECTGCGRRIDSDLPDLWECEATNEDKPRDLVRQRARYRRWTPDDIIGHQHSAVFCDQQCKDNHDAYRAECQRKEAHAIEVFKAKVLRRFPGVTFVQEECWRPHAYATNRNNRVVVEQVIVSFEFPGMTHGAASYRWAKPNRYTMPAERKPYFSCCNGDRKAFEAFAAQVQEKAA